MKQYTLFREIEYQAGVFKTNIRLVFQMKNASASKKNSSEKDASSKHFFMKKLVNQETAEKNYSNKTFMQKNDISTKSCLWETAGATINSRQNCGPQ